MILEEITVRNWRGYRKPHTFSFQDGINLIVGRNEAGKSTLFEVLTRVMFDRHNSKTEEIKAMQPIGSSLGPEASVVFRTGGTRYMIKKRFLQESLSEFYTERNGKWELDHTGDQADANVRMVLGGEVSSRTAVRPENRGIAQALWYLQSDGAVPDGMWNEVVRQGIQGMVRMAVRTGAENAFLEKLEDEYRKYWTPSGAEYSKSELIEVRSRISVLEKSLSDSRMTERRIAGYRTDLEELLELKSEKIKYLQEAEKEISRLSERLDDADAYERKKLDMEREVETLARNLKEYTEHLALVSAGQKENDELREQIRLQDELLSKKTVELNSARDETERHEFKIKNALIPDLNNAELQLRALQAARNLRSLEKDRERLQKHIGMLETKAGEIEEMKLERQKFLSPDNRELAKFNKIYDEHLSLNAKIEASAIRIAFRWETKRRKVTAVPQARSAHADEFSVGEPTEFRIHGVGTVTVRSGAEELKKLEAEAALCQKKLNDVFMKFGAENRDDIVSLNEKGREMDRAIEAAEKNFQELDNSIQDPKVELSRIIRGIEEEKVIASRFQLHQEDNRGSLIREMIRQKEKEKERLIDDISKEQSLENSARKRGDGIQSEIMSVTNGLSDMRARMQKNEASIGVILKTYGTSESLRELKTASEMEMLEKKSLFGKIEEGYEENVDIPRKLYRQAEASITALKDQFNDVERSISVKSAHIEDAVNDDNYTQIADIEIELTGLNRRLQVLQRRAGATRLLKLLVNEYERRRSAVLSGPVREIITPWLRFLTDGTYQTVHMDDALKPSSLAASGYDSDMPVNSLSHGTREQVIVLMRLAMGIIVSNENRNLIVIDDRLVNADAVRMKRLCVIIEEASKHCQILMATCNDTPYASLGAKIIRVPSDGL